MIEKVRIRGTQDLFLVTRIDWSRELARVISLQPTMDLAVEVPFTDIFPLTSMERPLESRIG